MKKSELIKSLENIRNDEEILFYDDTTNKLFALNLPVFKIVSFRKYEDIGNDNDGMETTLITSEPTLKLLLTGEQIIFDRLK